MNGRQRWYSISRTNTIILPLTRMNISTVTFMLETNVLAAVQSRNHILLCTRVSYASIIRYMKHKYWVLDIEGTTRTRCAHLYYHCPTSRRLYGITNISNTAYRFLEVWNIKTQLWGVPYIWAPLPRVTQNAQCVSATKLYEIAYWHPCM